MRVPNWENKLVEVITAAEKRPFNWGTHDCVTFASDVALAITGRDPIADLRGRWYSALSAKRELCKLGGIESAVCHRMGEPLAAPRSAGRGDVVLTDEGFLGVVVSMHAVAPKPMGLLRVEMNRWITGWRIA